MDENHVQTRQVLFCRNCGSRLIDGSIYCSKCGTMVGESVSVRGVTGSAPQESPPDNTEPTHSTDGLSESLCQADPVHPAKTRRKYVLLSCLGIILLVAIAFGILRFIPVKIEPQNINSINGCPEFFDVEFGMTVDQASALIDIAPENVMEYKAPSEDQDSNIFVSEDANYNLYGLPVQNIFCGFNGPKLNRVIIAFSKTKVKMSDVLSLYEKIYGQPSNANSWGGKTTTIEVIDDDDAEGIDQEIIVYYSMSPNSRYPMLSFDGPEIDPCGFLGDNYIFDQQIGNYIDGLVEDDDYTRSDLSAPGFVEISQYTLYPLFEYMGISRGETAIELSVEADQYINLVSYIFLLDASNVSDRVKFIEKRLVEIYGDYEDCQYTSLHYSDLGMEDISFEEFCKRVETGTQGNYHVQWETADQRITLTLTIRPEEKYYDGSVSFAPQHG